MTEFAHLDRSRPNDEDGCPAEEIVDVAIRFTVDAGVYRVPGLHPLTVVGPPETAFPSVTRYVQRHVDGLPNSLAAAFLAAARAQDLERFFAVKVPRFIADALP